MAQAWRIVGGGKKGGIVVRAGRELQSEEASTRLATGALVEELEPVVGGRMRFRKLAGEGPDEGWISVALKDQVLARRVDAQEAVSEEGWVLLGATRSSLGRKPRIACLHGGCANEHIMRQQLRPLLQKLGSEVEVCFVEGKHLTEEVRFDERGLNNVKTMRGVFGADQVLREHAVTTYGEHGDKGPFFYDRLDEGIAHSEACLAALQPIDALLGFSQGANFCTMLAARAVQGCEGTQAPYRCLVLLENDLPGWPTQKPELFESPLATPALVVSGHQESAAGDAVAKFFERPIAFRHDDGHRPLPRDRARSETLVDQIRRFVFQHCPP